MKNIFVLGGDGFCGWPTCLKLSKDGYKVHIIDNLSRRKIDVELDSNSLTKIESINRRLKIWNDLTNNKILFHNIDLSNEYDKLLNLINDYDPQVIIHLAEQRAAPYSMKNSKTARYTVNNNLNNTHNVLCAIVESKKDIHLIHLGTMGVYGYGTIPDTVLPEGYINVKMKNGIGQEMNCEILHPSYPGSIYHMTKTQDALFFQFFAKNYKLRITDLHQGIIWGFETEETKMHPELVNRFDYDSDYGTCLNRFIVQSKNNIPLTVYGTGEQTRAFINIQNSVECIKMAVENPPNKGDKVKIFNQMTETLTLNRLVDLIKKINPNTQVNNLDNPRNELVKNDLQVCNQKFLDLGLKPIIFSEEELKKIFTSLDKFHCNLKIKNILPTSFWKNFR